jgi:hypothetical protein
MATLAAEIQAAWDNQDHITLGYETWQSYTVGEFGRGNTAIAARQAIVGLLRGTGLSERAIAAEVGTSPPTVHNDLADLAAAQPVEQLITIPDPPAVVTGLDGRPHPASAGGMTAPERRERRRIVPPAPIDEQERIEQPPAEAETRDPPLTSAQRIRARDLLTDLINDAQAAKIAMSLSGAQAMRTAQWQERYEEMTAGLRDFTEGL